MFITQVETVQIWRLYKKYSKGGDWEECISPPIYTETAAVAIAEFMISHYRAHIESPELFMAVKCEDHKAYRVVRG